MKSEIRMTKSENQILSEAHCPMRPLQLRISSTLRSSDPPMCSSAQTLPCRSGRRGGPIATEDGSFGFLPILSFVIRHCDSSFALIQPCPLLGIDVRHILPNRSATVPSHAPSSRPSLG